MNTTSRTRVAILVSKLVIGGAEQLLLELLRHIDRNRFDIHLFFLRDPGDLGHEILQLGFPAATRIIRSKYDIAGVHSLMQVFCRFQPHALLLINHLNTLFYGVIAGRLAKIPTIINWENETWRKYPFHTWTMFGRRILHLGVDKVVAAAKGHADYIARVEHIPSDKISVIYNGVDPARFQSRLTASDARRRLGIPENSPVVSIVAALRPDKAHHVFLQAAKRVLQQWPHTHFLVIGDGPQAPVLKKLSSELGIAGSVHFLGFQRELGDILAAVDVNCLSSYPRQETLSVAALEAMAVGIPIVCTDVGFMKEIVFPGQTGYLVPVEDPKTLAECIGIILANEKLKQKMKDHCRRLVNETFHISTMAQKFEKLFETV
jgi:glycosyltransferase involved in cell wall biosynthesis